MNQNHEKQLSLFGHVFQISVSNGGVPKLPRAQVEITQYGITGDRQRNMEVHGGAERALCLYSLERIIALQMEGHPIFPGAIGENLTIAGLGWDHFGPGSRFQVGDDVLIEITSYTAPCVNIAGAFINQAIERVAQKQYPGWSRLYAKVIQEGGVKVGDRVVQLP